MCRLPLITLPKSKRRKNKKRKSFSSEKLVVLKENVVFTLISLTFYREVAARERRWFSRFQEFEGEPELMEEEFFAAKKKLRHDDDDDMNGRKGRKEKSISCVECFSKEKSGKWVKMKTREHEDFFRLWEENWVKEKLCLCSQGTGTFISVPSCQRDFHVSCVSCNLLWAWKRKVVRF